MTDHTTLSTNLRRILSELGRSAASVSREANLSTRFAQNILDGKVVSPRTDNLIRLADALNVSLSDLLAEDQGDGCASRSLNEFQDDAAPYDPKPGTDELSRVIKDLFPQRGTLGCFRIRRDLAPLMLARNDLIVCNLSENPSAGQLVTVNSVDPDTTISQTLIRRYVPPYLIEVTHQRTREPDVLDNHRNAIVGTIIGAIRGR